MEQTTQNMHFSLLFHYGYAVLLDEYKHANLTGICQKEQL